MLMYALNFIAWSGPLLRAGRMSGSTKIGNTVAVIMWLSVVTGQHLLIPDGSGSPAAGYMSAEVISGSLAVGEGANSDPIGK